MTFLKLVFFGSTAIVLFMFVGYPILLAIWAKFFPAKVQSGKASQASESTAAVSIVIAAHNEIHNIEQRITNLLAQNYDHRKVQIIIGSDGSTDGTVEKLESFRAQVEASGARLDVIQFEQRGGKSRVLNEAIKHCVHDLVILADMRQTFSADTIKNLVRRFDDPKVGAVSGELFLHAPDAEGGNADMGAYWRYEKMIRKLEARIQSTVGATGAIYAIRKALYQEVPEETLIEDVVIPMQICLQGYRVLFADDAHAYDIAPSNGQQEWLRKVRTLAGNWQLIKIRPQFLNPFRNPVWLQFMSHKLLRLALPFCLAAMFLTSYRIEGPTYTLAFTLQCFAYMVAIACIFSESISEMRIPSLIYFFCILNAAILVGLLRLLSGKTQGLWAFAYKAQT